MKKDQWILHIDLVSYDPKHLDPQESTVNLHIAFGSQQEMNDAFLDYHSSIGDHITIPGQYVIMAVEPSLYPTQTEPPAEKPPF